MELGTSFVSALICVHLRRNVFFRFPEYYAMESADYHKYRSTMKRVLCALAILAPLIALPLQPPPRYDRQEPSDNTDTRLPNGKSQQEEILKAEHEKTLKDAAALIELAEQLKADLEKNDRHVLSIAALKKTEEIEKLAKRIRTRLHH